MCTRFLRTQQTVELALQARRVPLLIDAGFDEVRADDFDGQPIETYWSWERQHAASERLPHGESMDEALLRHAAALRRLLSRTELVTFVVVREFALRHIAAAATTPSPTFEPSFTNAFPYLFDQSAIERAAATIGALCQSDRDEHRRREPVGERPHFTGEWNFEDPRQGLALLVPVRGIGISHEPRPDGNDPFGTPYDASLSPASLSRQPLVARLPLWDFG